MSVNGALLRAEVGSGVDWRIYELSHNSFMELGDK